MDTVKKMIPDFVSFAIEDGEIRLSITNSRMPTYDEILKTKHYIDKYLNDREEYEKERKEYIGKLHKQMRVNNTLHEEKEPEPTNVYLVHDTDNNYLKIGRSKNPKSRVETLQISTAYNLELIDVINDVSPQLETELHEYFKDIRINGEWFEYSNHIINKFKELKTL